jgi:hypothetical protein
MFYDQNKMTDAINSTAPFKEIELTLPEVGTTDILGALGGTANLDNIAISTCISAIMFPGVLYEEGDILPNEDGYVTEDGEVATEEQTVDTWVRVNIKFNPNYGGMNHLDRIVMQPVTFPVKQKDPETGEIVAVDLVDTISASMNKNVVTCTSLTGKVTKVRLKTRLDTSNGMLETCSVKWEVDTELVEIDTSIPINTTISPEEVKDLAALYQVNQLTRTALAPYMFEDPKRIDWRMHTVEIEDKSNVYSNHGNYFIGVIGLSLGKFIDAIYGPYDSNGDPIDYRISLVRNIVTSFYGGSRNYIIAIHRMSRAEVRKLAELTNSYPGPQVQFGTMVR